MKKIFSILAFLFLIFIVSFLIWYKDNGFGPGGLHDLPNENENQQNYLLSFEFDKDNIISLEYPYDFSADKNIFELTEALANQQNWIFTFDDYGDMGILISQIGEQKNGQDQKYWQFFVDDKQPQISVEKYYPEPGKTIEWKFIKSEL